MVDALRLRAAIHARRSLNRRDEQSASVRRQITAGEELAGRIGAEVVKVFDEDDTSAFEKRVVTLPNGRRVKRNVRPDWQEALRWLYDGRIDVLIEYDLDRAMREPRDLEDLIEIVEMTGRSVESVTGSLRLRNDAEITMARVLVAMANKSSRDTSRRVRDATKDRALQGRNHGGRRAYGFTADGMHLVPDEAREVAQMFDRFLNGVPLGAIVRDLNVRGVTTVGGKEWASNTVRGTLLRARHAGLSEYKGEVVAPGQWPQIVDEQVWRATVALLKDPSRRSSTGNRAAHLLSGIATCGVCGGPITSAGAKRSQPDGGIRHIYRCRPAVGKPGYCVGRRRDWCDEYVTTAVIRRLSRPDARDLLVDDQAPNFDALRVEANALRERLDEAAAGFAEGLLTVSQLRVATLRIKDRLAAVEVDQARQDRPAVLVSLVETDDVQAVWDGLQLDEKRAVVQTLADVVLHPGGGGKRTFDASKVEIRWKA